MTRDEGTGMALLSSSCQALMLNKEHPKDDDVMYFMYVCIIIFFSGMPIVEQQLEDIENNSFCYLVCLDLERASEMERKA